MSVNPQTPNERTNEQTKFSISPISHSLAGRGNEEVRLFSIQRKTREERHAPVCHTKMGYPAFFLSFRATKAAQCRRRIRWREREQSTPVQSFKPRTNGRTETEIHDTEPIYHRDNFELLNSPPFPPFQHHRTNWRD